MEKRSLSRFLPVALFFDSAWPFPLMGYLKIRVPTNELLKPPFSHHKPIPIDWGALNLPTIRQGEGYTPLLMSPVSHPPPRATSVIPPIQKLVELDSRPFPDSV